MSYSHKTKEFKSTLHQEKTSSAAELIIANKELLFQNQEKEARAAELAIANNELLFQNHEKENRAAELIILNQELTYQNEVKDKFALELKQAYKKIKKVDEYLKEHVKSLEQMTFMTSHRVRKPVANIIGLTGIIGDFINSPTQLKKLINYIKVSATSLDMFVNEFTLFISELEQKGIAASDFTAQSITDGGDVNQHIA